MTRTLRDKEVTGRLRDWIDDGYGAVRGKFTLLEEQSGIAAQSWKNVYYRRQLATESMLSFVQKTNTDEYQWVVTGFRVPVKDGYPFDRPPTAEEQLTLTSRLIWAVKDFASPRGADLFTYLESRWHNTVSANDWATVIFGKAPATALMVEQICKQRPHLAAWIATGSCAAQVDPTDDASIEQWKKAELEWFETHASAPKTGGK